MRVAFYGGSFDPFHNGHLAIVRALRARDLCDEILLAPSAISPGKPESLTSGFHRLAMTRLGVKDLDDVTVTDMDLRRPGPSYTVHSLSTLRKERPDCELILVVGGDAWRDFRAWRDPERILRLARILVFPRDGHVVNGRDLPDTVRVLDDFAEPVSSTDLRRRLAVGQDMADLVPPLVMRYIQAHGLYANDTLA
jgi:nicotinate-nucleotide adenylyltransferase